MLELRNVSFYYEEKHKILDHISLMFPSHGLVMIEGESGSGKSTLLSLLHHEKEVKEGDILFFHQSLKEMNEQEKMDYRFFSCGVVYQDYGLFSHLSIEENLKMFMLVINKNEDIPTLLKKVGLSIDPKTNVDVLSGGEKQRVAIARSMILTSPILLLDEPTSSLDDKNAFEIMDLLKELSKKSLIIIVTHDQRMIKQYSDEHYHMENGTLTLIKKEEVESVSYSFLHLKRKRFHYGMYLKRRLVHKKKRAILLVSFLSMSVFIGSFSAILMHNMKEEMTSSFSHFASGKEIQMTVKNENIQDNRYSLNKEEFVTIQKENQDIDMMFYYEEDLSYAFPSRNEFRIFSLPGYPLLKGFKMETLNHFHLLKETESYPSLSYLENDEIVIGIEEKTLNELCDTIQIEASYEALGNYLKRNPLSIGIQIKSIDWDYEDEQLLLVKGVTKAKEPTIYHSNPYFNEYIIEERMRMRSTLSWYEEVEYPWIFHKRSKIKIKDKESLSSSFLSKYLFDETKENNTYLISKNDKSYISPYDISRILSWSNEIEGAFIGSERGYQVFSNTILHGLSGVMLIDSSYEALYEKEEKWRIENKKDNDLLFHSVLYPSEQTLSLHPSKEGIYISSSLAKLKDWKKGDVIYYLYSLDHQTYVGEWIIDGIKKEKENILYISNDELNSLFLKHKITTSSYLKATSALFFIKNSRNVESLIKELNSLYPEYYFASPSYTFLSTLEKTTSSIQKGLSIFSLWMMIFSSFLFTVIHALFLYECEKDAERIEALGYDKKAKEKLSFYLHLIFFLLSSVFTLLDLVLLGLFSKSSFIKNHLSFSFQMNIQSLSTYLLFSIVLYIITFIMVNLTKIKKAKKFS
ncbi:uncharacterized protein BN794_01219 [Coprobacillus sp. CAG:826]|nr:uncharacterized protein BN794_01219 [Coprobacillus sp. CAG:826]